MFNNQPDFAEGPFSWVFFFIDPMFGLRTYTYRVFPVSPKGTKLRNLVPSTMCFDRVFKDTQLMPRKV